MKLFLVGTPLGNLSDFSARGIETLKSVDFIAAEDTRVTLKLLNHFEIKKTMISYHEHNAHEAGKIIISRIINGETCALVSDAGMPCISDPGELLVMLCDENGIEVCPIPGPSAAITALCISGLDTSRFCFEGFLSQDKGKRRLHLARLFTEDRTMIFYEAPHRIASTLQEMLEQFGNRKIAVVKELTKIHESVKRFSLEQAIEFFRVHPPKGEYVLIVEGSPERVDQITTEQAVEIAEKLLDRGHKPSEAAKEAAKISGFKKAEIYKLLIDKLDR